MHHALAPIPCKPWSLSGLSERLIVSHYENDYGAAVRSLNATRADLDALVLGDVPAYQLLAMKREEIAATNSVILHELYFGSLGGDGGVLFTGSGHGNQILEPISTALRQAFGSVVKWKEAGRDALGLRIIDDLRADLRYAVRTMRRTPASSPMRWPASATPAGIRGSGRCWPSLPSPRC